MFELARTAGNLDVNSCYHYILLSYKFTDTCAVAVQGGELAGFATGFRDPNHPEVLFIWQVAVSNKFRNGGIAKAMLKHILQRNFNPSIRFLEATITPSNKGSQALFQSLANELNCSVNKESLISASLFPENGHEPESLFCLGPLGDRCTKKEYI
ncbi:MAG: diaminobutyrate acetyltransferase [Candidatus Nitronauta litoralis]|uniref:L-2,4-diaminobutyric acid acetyltransferase n=1 Tax=Candidatus Nitronauta litoralis TaxID=2705533 RepID=A0A7T0BU23_9BACT|nr:MAG: diaminobutyrate acetyltransferase [Candidatus Nitronauta litoralis]